MYKQECRQRKQQPIVTVLLRKADEQPQDHIAQCHHQSRIPGAVGVERRKDGECQHCIGKCTSGTQLCVDDAEQIPDRQRKQSAECDEDRSLGVPDQKGQGEQVVKTWRQVETFPEQRRTIERPFLVMDQSACNFQVTDLVRAVECNVKEVDLYGPQDGDKDQRYPVA